MLPTHNNASELNVLCKENENKNCAGSRELSFKFNNLIGRRLAHHNIPPIDVNLPYDNTDNASIQSTSLIVSKSSKFLDIGFKNLSYISTTGIFKRSE